MSARPSPTQPLAGIRVLDSADAKGEFCGRLLADLGAEVIRLEPPEGAATRTREPRTPDGGASLYFALRNAGKGSLRLDVAKPAGRELLHRLLERFDVWIESSKPGVLEELGLAPADVSARHPRLVLTSITDFGRTGPYARYEGSSLIGFAMGGMMHKSGSAERPPCNAPGHLATDTAGLCAAFPTLMALYQRMKTGRGQHIDCSVFESIANIADWSIPNASLNPAIQTRSGPGIYPLYRASDGFVRMVMLVTAHWHALLDWMGHPEELSDPKYDQFLARLMEPHVINPVIERFFLTQKKVDICVEGQRRGIPVTPLLEPGEVLSNEHVRARRSFRSYDVGGGIEAPLPSGFCHLSGERIGPKSGPPAPGRDEDRVYGEELEIPTSELADLRAKGVI